MWWWQIVAGILCMLAALPCAGVGFYAASFCLDGLRGSGSSGDALPGLDVVLTVFAGVVTSVALLATIELTALGWMLLRGGS